MRRLIGLLLTVSMLACTPREPVQEALGAQVDVVVEHQVALKILGTIQDAGSPHAACKKACCKDLFSQPDPTRQVVSLGLVDRVDSTTCMIEASPDIVRQMKHLRQWGGPAAKETPDAIFLTHAHIGHYTGLMYLGKESMGADRVPVYAMPEMASFLTDNGPWSQLVADSNIVLQPLQADSLVRVSASLAIKPVLVPHRDEYSETVGYYIYGPRRIALFIPDIDKWSKWQHQIADILEDVDYALVDGTFYDAAEINNRDIREIPHPFIIESMALLADLPVSLRDKVYFIHLNHTNPAIDTASTAYRTIEEAGYHVAQWGQELPL